MPNPRPFILRSCVVMVVVLWTLVLSGQEASTKPVEETTPVKVTAPVPEPSVQLAILLDSSSSMGGLIRQAQTRLWKIVNEFALAKLDGKPVVLEVALYEYGKNTLPASDLYIRKILPLSDNLDKASEELFALKANTISGGDEYAGATIRAAVRSLAWSESNDILKVLVVAGNESFAQGPVDYRKACRDAIGRGIMVNTIYCGAYASGISSGWKNGARLADGVYCSIDQNRMVADVAAPQDAAIVELGTALNKTYLPFGKSGQEGLRRQTVQDKNAASAGQGVQTQRAVLKGTRLYNNAEWDLVDAVKEGRVKLEDVEEDALPEPMQKLKLDERKAFVKKQAEKRAELQNKITRLNQARKQYVEKAKAQQAPQPARPPSARRFSRARGMTNKAEAEAGGNAKDGDDSAPAGATRKRSNAKKAPADPSSKSIVPSNRRPARPQSFDGALIDILRRQAKKKRIQFREPKKPETTTDDKSAAKEKAVEEKKAPAASTKTEKAKEKKTPDSEKQAKTVEKKEDTDGEKK